MFQQFETGNSFKKVSILNRTCFGNGFRFRIRAKKILRFNPAMVWNYIQPEVWFDGAFNAKRNQIKS